MKPNISLYSVLTVSALLFTSCNVQGEISNVGSIFIYALLIVALIGFWWFVNRRKNRTKKETKSVSEFNNKIKGILAKCDTHEEKIKALDYAFERIDNNDEYQKNLAWRNSLLISIYLHKVTIYHEIGDEDNALDACNRIIELNPKHALSYYNRGYIYNAKQIYHKALEDFQRYLVLDPKATLGLQDEANEYISKIEKNK